MIELYYRYSSAVVKYYCCLIFIVSGPECVMFWVYGRPNCNSSTWFHLIGCHADLLSVT